MAEHEVVFSAIARWAQVQRESNKTVKNLDQVKRKVREVNAAGVGDAAAEADTLAKNTEKAARATDLLSAAKRRQVQASRAASAAEKATQAGYDALSRTAQRLSAVQATLLPQTSALAREARGSARDHNTLSRALGGVESAASGVLSTIGRVGRAMREAAADGGNFGNTTKSLKSAFFEANAGGSRFSSTMIRVVGIGGAVISLINLLSSLISPLGAGFIGLAGAIAPAAGLLGALPGLLAGVGGVVGTLLAGFTGIGGALKAYTTQQKAATKTAQTQTKATQALGKAQNSQARQQVTNARSIASAERSVTDAQERAREAQKAVNAARAEAARSIRDLKDQVKDLALQEEGASISLEEARDRLAQVNADPGSSALERRSANLAVKEAQARLGDVKDAQVTNSKDLDAANKKGILGSDQVVAAKKAEVDANQQVVDATQSLADAQADAAQATKDAADAVSDAAVATTAGSAATDEYAAAMADLTPEARAVVEQLIKMKPLIDGIRAAAQKGVMPGFLSFLKDSVKLFPQLTRFVSRVSNDFGDFFTQVGRALTTDSALRRWGRVFDATGDAIDTFLDIAFNVGVVIGNILEAAAPLTQWLLDSVKGWTESWKAMTSGEAGQRRLTRFFRLAQSTAKRLGSIIGNLVGGLKNVASATAPLGRSMLKTLDDITDRFKTFTGSVEGQNALADWAKKSGPVLHELGLLLGDVVKGILDLGSQTDIGPIISQIRTELLPAVLKVFGLFTGDTLTQTIRAFSALADVIASLVGGGGGGLAGFIKLVADFLEGLDYVINNVPLAREAIKLFIGTLIAFKVAGFIARLTNASLAFTAVKDGANLARKAIGKYNLLKIAPKRAAGDIAKASGAAPKRAAPLAEKAAGGVAGKAGSVAKGVGSAVGTAVPSIIQKAPSLIGKILPLIRTIGIVASIAGRAILAALGPVGLIILGIVTVLSIAIPLIIKHWDTIKGVFFKAVDAIKGFFAPIVAFFVDVFTRVANAVAGPLAVIGRIFSFTFRLIAAIIGVGFQIINALVRIAIGLFILLIVRPLVALAGLVWKALQAVGAFIGRAVSTWLAIVKAIWGLFVTYVVGPIAAAFRAVKRAFIAIGKWIADKARDILAGFKIIWGLIKTYIITPIAQALAPVGRFFLAIFNKIKTIVQPLVDFIKEKFHAFIDLISGPIQTALEVVGRVLGKIRDKFVDIVTKIGNALKPLKDVVASAFKALKAAFSDPIDFVVNKIINPGIIDPMIKLFDATGVDVGLKRIEWSPPAFAEGGRVPGASSGVKRDNVLAVNKAGRPMARVEGGEFIMPRKQTRENYAYLERMRRGGRPVEAAGQGYRDGGLISVPSADGGGGGSNKHVNYKGGEFSSLFAGRLQGAEQAADVNFNVFQGGFRPATSYSGTSHAGDAVDLGPVTAAVVAALRGVGIAAWRRGPAQGFTPHIHGVPLPGAGYAGGSGKWQAQDYLNGGDGLGGKDYEARGKGIGDVVSGVFSFVGDFANGLSDKAKSLLGNLNPLEWVKSKYNAVKGSMSSLGDSPFVKAITSIPGKIIGGIKDFISEKIGSLGGSADSGGSAGASGVYNALTSSGFTPAQAAGIMGNMQAESGFNPRIVQGGGSSDDPASAGSSGYGLVQWTPGSKLKAYIGNDKPTIENEINALVAQLNGKGPYPEAAAGAALRRATTPEQAARVFGLQYERYAGGVQSGRESAARNFFNQYSKGGKGYARGTNQAGSGWKIVGENGPEAIRLSGGEKIKNADQTKRLPGYYQGGVVRGVAPGASGQWVRALRSQMYMGTGTKWDRSLSSALRNRDGAIGVSHFQPNQRWADLYVKALQSYLKNRGKKKTNLDDWHTALGFGPNGSKTDPTYWWRMSDTLAETMRKKKVSTSKIAEFQKGAAAFGSQRKGWVKSLEGKLGLRQDGVWGSEISGPLKHIMAHGFGWKVGSHGHGTYDSAPWRAGSKDSSGLVRDANGYTAIDRALEAQQRTNRLNAEWDRYLAQFSGWGLDYVVRKMNDLGISDGMTLARSLSKSKRGAAAYNTTLKTEYDRADAADPNTDAGKAAVFLQEVNKGGASMQSLARVLQTSNDTVARMYATLSGQGRLRGIAASKISRLSSDVKTYNNLFRFATGGDVPGSGNGDTVSAMLEPGEFVLRKAATAELRRRYGDGGLSYLNNIDRFANGGFVAGGVSTRGFNGRPISVSSSRSADASSTRSVVNNFNTNVYNPTLEDGAVSVQKRVTRVARLGLLSGDPR